MNMLSPNPDRPVSPGRKRNVLVFFDLDRVIYNFFLEGAFDDICKSHRVAFAMPPLNKRFKVDTEPLFRGLEHYTVPPDEERAALWSRMAMLDQLKLRSGEHWRKLRRMRRLAMSFKERLTLSVLAMPGLRHIEQFRIGRRLDRGRPQELERILDSFKPEIVIYPTAFNGIYTNDLVVACRNRGIPTVYIMNSWDNPSSKSVMSDCPDYVFVWGPQTAEHCEKYMRVPKDRIVTFGSAQMEMYYDPQPIDRDALAREIGLDTSRPIILYGSSSLAESEFSWLELLDNWCDAQAAPKPQILYRPHPYMPPEIAERVTKAGWRNIVVQPSSDHSHSFFLSDLRSSARERLMALQLSDAVVSPLSTILLEGMLLGKPLLCIRPKDQREGIFAPRNAPLTHFTELLANPDVIMVEELSEFEGGMDRLARQIGDKALVDRLGGLAEFFVGRFKENYSVRLNRFVKELQSAEADAS